VPSRQMRTSKLHGGLPECNKWITLRCCRLRRQRPAGYSAIGHADQVAMVLGSGEPAAGSWRVQPVEELVRLVFAGAGEPEGRPRTVAIDGRRAVARPPWPGCS
jgi:hypothetical protein